MINEFETETDGQTHQKLLLLLLGRLVVKLAGLDNFVIYIEFEPCSLIHCFLYTLLRDETKNEHRFGLTDTVSTILCLEIGVGVPISNNISMAIHLTPTISIYQSESKLWKSSVQ